MPAKGNVLRSRMALGFCDDRMAWLGAHLHSANRSSEIEIIF
jgi:hypothetical protein